MQDFVERGGTTDEKAIACLGRQVATGLKHVHGKGYAHRDVKPSNILLERSGIAKLADFGIASKCDNEASTRTFVGTAQYMSPERIRGDAYTTAADVWGLGVSLLAVVRGSAPFGSQEKKTRTRSTGGSWARSSRRRRRPCLLSGPSLPEVVWRRVSRRTPSNGRRRTSYS